MKKIEIYNLVVVCLLSFMARPQLGQLDESFNVKPKFIDLSTFQAGGGEAYSIVHASDGKYFVSGRYGFPNSTKRYLIKFNKDHSIDTTFNVTFGNSTHVLDVAVQDDGKVIICGDYINNVNGAISRNVIRLNSDGSIDASFLTGSGPTDSNGNQETVKKIQVLPNGQIAVIGQFVAYNGVARPSIVLLNSDGSVDLNFNPGFNAMPSFGGEFLDLKFMNNVIGLCGNFSMQFYQVIGGNSVQRTIAGFVVLNLDGSIPISFTDTGLNPSIGGSMTMTALNNEYFVCSKNNGTQLGVYDINGVENTSFNFSFPVTDDNLPITDLHTLPDSSIVYLKKQPLNQNCRIGRISNQGIIHFNHYVPFGNFNVTSIAIFDSVIMYNQTIPTTYTYYENSDRLIFGFISIETGNIIAERWGNGIRGISSSNVGKVKVIRMLPDGSFYAAGNFSSYNFVNTKGLVKVEKNGYLDHSFNTGSGFEGSNYYPETLVEDVLVLANGDIIVGGDFFSFNGANVQKLAKLNSSGNLVPNFFQNYQFTNSFGLVRKIKMFNNQIYILFTGSINYVPTNQIYTNIIRLNLDGSIDPTFILNNGNASNGGFGISTSILDFNFQSTGDMIVAGNFAYYDPDGGELWRNLIRIKPSGVLDTTFFDGQTFKFNNSETSSLIQIKCVNVLPDNTILCTGQFTKFDTLNCGGIVKLTANGTIDTTFNSGIGFPYVSYQNTNNDISSLVQPDGKIIFYGQTAKYYNNSSGLQSNSALTNSRINSNGSVDVTFSSPNDYYDIHSLGLQTNGSLIVGSCFPGNQTVNVNTYDAPKFINRIFNDTNFVTGLTSNITMSSLDCSNYGVTLNAYNGVQPYTYSWNDGAFSTNNSFTIDSTDFYSYQVQDSTGVIDGSQIYVFMPESIVDFSTNLITSQFRSGFNNTIFLNTSNFGCVESDAQLMLVKNSPIVLTDIVPAPDLVNGDTLIWNLNSTNYLDGQFSVVMNSYTPSSMQIGDSVYLDLIIQSDSMDIDSTNNSKFYVFPVLNGYDPNDKKVYPVGQCIPKYILDERLTYTIRFQNTGNSEAINISVLDSISNQLDMNTFRLISNSHPVEVEMLDSNVISFNFENINLPDSLTSQVESQGYVVFEIFPKQDLAFGNEITNEAFIYFDFNIPILTNEVLNTFSDGSHNYSEVTFDLTGCDSVVWNNQIYYNPGQYFFNSSNIYGCDSLSILNVQVNLSMENEVALTGIDSVEYNGIYYSANGVYEVNFVNEMGCDSTVFLNVLLGYSSITDHLNETFVLFPNPTFGTLELRINSVDAKLCKISDVRGRILMEVNLESDYNLLDLSRLEAGIYLVNLFQDQKIVSTKRVLKL